MSYLGNKFKGAIGKKVKKILFKILKPLLPFILIILVVLFLVSFLLDSIFVSASQTDSSQLSETELRIKNMCIQKAQYLNICDNYIGTELTNQLLDVNHLENEKMIEWSHLYTLMTLENLNNSKEMNQELLDNISESFKSTFKYEKNIIKTEEKEIKDKKEKWKVLKEETQYILIESNTIQGHYFYEYEEIVQSSEDGKTRVTKKKYKNEKLQGNQYQRLEEYLKNNMNLTEYDIKTCIDLVINSSSGYYDETNNNINSENSFISKGMFTWPIPGYTNITSEYGYRIHPISRKIQITCWN